MTTLALHGWALCALLMLLLWLVELRTRDAGIVDAGWAAGLGLLAVYYAAEADGWAPRRVLTAVLAGSWSVRLAGHLLVDRVLGKPEDGRYQTLRRLWGENAHRNFFFFFQGQALLDAILAFPILIVCMDPRAGFGLREGAAAALLSLSVVGESVADAQLARFRGDPARAGTTCRIGLWRYSRHPNYFFEWLHWWTYVVLAAGTPLWVFTLASPALMLLFLFKVTGIPATEAQALKSRKDYADYQRTTSSFVPWFPGASAA